LLPRPAKVGSLKIIYPSKEKQNEMIGKIGKIRERARNLRREAENIVVDAQKRIEQMILT